MRALKFTSKSLAAEGGSDLGGRGNHLAGRKSTRVGTRGQWEESGSVALAGGGACSKHLAQVDCSHSLEVLLLQSQVLENKGE